MHTSNSPAENADLWRSVKEMNKPLYHARRQVKGRRHEFNVDLEEAFSATIYHVEKLPYGEACIWARHFLSWIVAITQTDDLGAVMNGYTIAPPELEEWAVVAVNGESETQRLPASVVSAFRDIAAWGARSAGADTFVLRRRRHPPAGLLLAA